MQYLDSTLEYSCDPENARYMIYYPHSCAQETADFLKKCDLEWSKPLPDFYEFAVIKEGEHIGGITLYIEDERRTAELGWILNKRYWGNGYAYEAANALIEFASRTLGIKRFIAMCDSGNTASYKIMEKLGMHRMDDAGRRRNKLALEIKYDLAG